MPLLDMAALQATSLHHDPFDYLVVPGFVHMDALAEINRDFPAVPGPGSWPPLKLTPWPAATARARVGNRRRPG